MSDAPGPEDYRCRHCHNLVLYRSDHTIECRHHPIHDLERRQS